MIKLGKLNDTQTLICSSMGCTHARTEFKEIMLIELHPDFHGN